MTKKISRREFLKAAAAGATTIALLPPLAQAAILPNIGGTTQGLSYALLAQGKASTIAGVDHRIIMSGAGRVDPRTRETKGTGIFNHYDNATLGQKTILSSGRWVSTALLSLNIVNTWGAGPFAAGVLEMSVNLNQTFPSVAVTPATLKIVSNIGSAGLSTKQREGFTLTIPNAPFGPFSPLSSRKRRKGLAVFTLGDQQGITLP